MKRLSVATRVGPQDGESRGGFETGARRALLNHHNQPVRDPDNTRHPEKHLGYGERVMMRSLLLRCRSEV